MQGQILNDIGNAYANATVPWLETLLPMAQRLFLLLATIELIWSGIWWAMATRQDEIIQVDDEAGFRERPANEFVAEFLRSHLHGGARRG